MTTTTTPKRQKLYASFDIEADGNNAGQHSMLSLGICFISSEGAIIDEVSYNLFARKDRTYEARCVGEFWFKQKDAWDFVHQNRITPEQAMQDLSDRLYHLSSMWEIDWAAWPACFDWQFLKVYYETFGPPDKYDIGYSCADIGSEIKSIAKAMGKSTNEVADRFKVHNTFPHMALADARCQGLQYVNFMLWRRGLKKQLSSVTF